MKSATRCVLVCLGLVAHLLVPVSAKGSIVLGGDPIGPDNTLTNGNGATTSTAVGAENFGHVGLVLDLSEATRLESVRAIVSAIPGGSGIFDDVRFTEFMWQASIWSLADYFAGEDPEFIAEIGQPPGVVFETQPNGDVLPSVVFGNTGPLGNDANTYDFEWDLGIASEFDTPLGAGQWVFGLQTNHGAGSAGVANISKSFAPGPAAVWSSDVLNFPRSYPFGVPPNDTTRWAVTVKGSAVPEPSIWVMFALVAIVLVAIRLRTVGL